MADERAIFVVGVGRSGTSLLQSMLAAHSELAFPPETGFLRRYGAAGTITALARRSSRSDIATYLEGDSRLQRIKISIPDVLDDAAQAGALTDFSVYRSLLSAYAKSVGKPHVGDKDPRLIEYLDILHTTYPEAGVVQIVRDPRDVLASKKKADWSKSGTSLRHVFAYYVQIENGRRQGRKWFGSRYHEIVYESLLADPEEELRVLCDGLEIGFEKTMLQFSDAASSLVAADEMSWKRETIGPLLEKNFGKWRNTLSDYEVALVELSCATAMRRFEYPTSSAWKHLAVEDRLWVLVFSAFIVLTAPVYRVYRLMKNWLVRRGN